MKHLASNFTLPNGSILQNRIAKSAMSENMGTLNNAPTKNLIDTYRVWAKGKPGLLITGNVMIDSKALGEPGTLLLKIAQTLICFKNGQGQRKEQVLIFGPK